MKNERSRQYFMIYIISFISGCLRNIISERASISSAQWKSTIYIYMYVCKVMYGCKIRHDFYIRVVNIKLYN